MADFLLHGLWVQRSGLHLWLEQIKGHRVVLPDAVPQGTFPPSVEELLSGASFRHRLRTTLRTPKGREVALVVPTAAYAPEQAVEIFARLSFLNTPNAAATGAQREAIAPDLMWLLRFNEGMERFVKAGRVTIKLSYEDDQWYPQWQLAQGLGERSWVAEMAAAAPGILTVNNRNLQEDLTETLPHWIASAYLEDLKDTVRPYPWHEFPDALLRSRPLRRGGVGLLNRLKEWKESIAVIDQQLVIILEEPNDAEITGGDPDDAMWAVRVQVRSGVDSPRPVDEDHLDRDSLNRLNKIRDKAITVSRHLDSSVNNAARAYARTQVDPRMHGGDNAGDWDVYLTTTEVVDFVARDVARLRAAGITVLLPKAWAVGETTARLETAEADNPAEGATTAHIGMDKLADYNWRLSIGDTELTDAEMNELVNSKSGLIKLRDQWVMADTGALGRITGYMEDLAQRSRKRQRNRLNELSMKVEQARATGDPRLDELEAELERLTKKFNDTADDAGFGEVTVSELRQIALESMAEQPIEFTGSTWFSSLLGGTEGPAPSRVDLPESIHADLRDYQRCGVDWLYWMSRNNIGAVLADDMGLGKTLQLLSMLEVEKTKGLTTGPSLVIAPTSVVGNWAAEAERFIPDLKVIVHHGPDRARQQELFHEAKNADLVITSYGVVSRDFLSLGAVHWDHVVLDEAQHIKNSSTRSSRAARSLPARHRIALTGTPVENRLSEMRSILDFVNPGILGSVSFFRNHFAKAIERENDEAATEKLRALSAPFIMRRLKTDPSIIDDLPEKTERVVTVPMTNEQAALYTAYVNDVQQRIADTKGIGRRGLVLTSITRIKQICNHPAHFLGDGSPVTTRGVRRSDKVEELVQLVRQSVAEGKRMLVFTQYRAFGDLLQPYLSDLLGEDIPFLHGAVSKTGRDKMVARFQSEDGPPLMLLSLKAGGTGLNLTAATVVVHMDRWWNPAVENQATDRAFRIGQRNNVEVYKMITAGTLEESIQDILDGKLHLAGAVVGEGEGWITELEPDELAQLMSYRGRSE